MLFVGDEDSDNDNDFENNESDDEGAEIKQFGKRHWERSDHPIVQFKEEKVIFLKMEFRSECKCVTH